MFQEPGFCPVLLKLLWWFCRSEELARRLIPSLGNRLFFRVSLGRVAFLFFSMLS